MKLHARRHLHSAVFLTWIIGGAKEYLCPTNSIIGGRVRAPAAHPKSTPMHSCLATISLAIKRKNFAFVQLPALQLIFSATWVVNFTLVGTAT